jgi:alpha-beta hydrolase superfamily lysophospholipase
MGRPVCQRRCRTAAIVALAGIALWPVANRFTHHPDETLIVLMPPLLGALLWWGWPRVRRIRLRQYVGYLVFLALLLGIAGGVAAYIARGRLSSVEIFWAVYFAVCWRLAWAVWARTVGRLGERLRRWGRRTRRSAGGLRHIADAARRRWAVLALGIAPTRFLLVVLVFAPLLVGSLIHRLKIGNPLDRGEAGVLPIEDVWFTTADGLTLSGWYLPDRDSDATVIICHGLGANKGNFSSFLSVFHGQGYNALIFDFRGHGESAGHTATFGLYEEADVRAAVAWLRAARPAASHHIFGLGSSMGAMALVRAAADDPRIEAVVLDSAFVSAPLLAQQHLGRIPVVGPVLVPVVLASLSLHAGQSLWQLDATPALARLAPRPVLLIHGTDDVLIPPVNLDLMYERAGEPKVRWLGPGPHSNVMSTDFDTYQTRVIEFLDRARGVTRQP